MDKNQVLEIKIIDRLERIEARLAAIEAQRREVVPVPYPPTRIYVAPRSCPDAVWFWSGWDVYGANATARTVTT